MSRMQIALLTTLLVACQDSPMTPRKAAVPDDPLLATGGIPGPPPHVIIPGPPGPPPRVPVPLPPNAGPPSFLSDIVEVGAGLDYSCALRSDGVTYCWGTNYTGQLGDGSLAPSSVPVEVSGPARFARLFVGNLSACGLTSSGAAYCWGGNANGMLGAGLSASASQVPVPVAGGHSFVEIAIGLVSMCGLGTDGVTYCWGRNTNGELGIGTAGGSSNVPVAVANSAALQFTTVSVGFMNACALTAGGAAYCWGGMPQLFGNAANPPNTFAPMPAANGLTLANIAAASLFACGVDASGVAYCWGSQVSGELGTGSFASPVQTPALVTAGLTFASFDSYNNNSIIAHTCGVTTTGDTWCWGSNQYGQLGAASAANCTFGASNYTCSASPVRVSGGNTFEAVAVGGRHVCALDLGKQVWCWGANNLGQLGDGTMIGGTTPVRVRGLTAPQQSGSIVVTPSLGNLILLGSTVQFTAALLDENGVPAATQPVFAWSSSDPAVAPVSAAGIATALTTGQTILTATAPNGMTGKGVLSVNILDPVVAFQQAWVGGGNSDGVVVLGGLLSDEWNHSGTFLTRREVDMRSITASNLTVDQAYARLALARTALEFEAARVQGASPSDPRIGQMLVLAGYTYIAFAETYCSGVPLDDPDVGKSTTELFNLAEARFAQAMSGPIAAPYTTLATAGAARARLGLGNFAGAAAAAAGVPSGFTYNTTHSNVAGQENFVYQMTAQRRISVADGEGSNGLLFRTATDPRVPWTFVGIGFDGSTPTYALTKYASESSPVTIASDIEARLIEAEAALHGGTPAQFLVPLNALRLAAGYSALADPGTLPGRVDLLFSERAFWLYATGARLGDVRRLINHYGRAANTVLPVGSYPRGGSYGTDANLPVPVSVRGSAYAGCTDRGS